jgi:hypothetical protein
LQTLRWSRLARSAPLRGRPAVARDSVATLGDSEPVAEFITILSDIREEFV